MSHQNYERDDVLFIDNDKWLKYDEDDREYFAQKAKGQKKWAGRSQRD